MSSVTFTRSTNFSDTRCDYCFKAAPYTSRKWSHMTNSGSECCRVHLVCLKDHMYREGPTSLCGKHIVNHADLPKNLCNAVFGDAVCKAGRTFFWGSGEPILNAFKGGDLSKVVKMIEKIESYEERQWMLGAVVKYAARNNLSEYVKQLDQNLRNESGGKTSLDIITDEDKKTAVETAIQCQNNDLIKLLMEKSPATFKMVELATMHNNTEIVPFLLERSDLSPEQRTELVIQAAKIQNMALATWIKNNGDTVSEKIFSSSDLGWMAKCEILKNDIQWTPVVAALAITSAVMGVGLLLEYAT